MPDEIKGIEKRWLEFADQWIEGILYDLDLLPEQLIRDTREWSIMKTIIALKHKLEDEKRGE